MYAKKVLVTLCSIMRRTRKLKMRMCCKMVSLKTVLFDYLKIVIFGAFEVE